MDGCFTASIANKMSIPIDFAKILKDSHLPGTGSKMLKVSLDSLFDISFRKDSKFIAVVLYLLLSCCKLPPMIRINKCSICLYRESL